MFQLLSQICLGLGMFIMLIVLFSDNSWYLLNLFVQSIGYYFQHFIGLGFQTDAFAQEGNVTYFSEQIILFIESQNQSSSVDISG